MSRLNLDLTGISNLVLTVLEVTHIDIEFINVVLL